MQPVPLMHRGDGEHSALTACGSPFLLPHARQLDIVSRRGQEYRILIDIPPDPAPATGLPVIFMVDGNALFPSAVAAARLQRGRSEVTGVTPAILVGIGYPGDDVLFHDGRRRQDLLPDQGGADRFLDFIAHEAMPVIASIAPVDCRRQSLVGHSLGGLFVLHALFTRAALFRSYVAGSPSIWWNECEILSKEAAFRSSGAGAADRRLLIAVGGDERSPDSEVLSERARRLRMARMVGNASEMAERLTASGHIFCQYVLFDGENHISVVPAMLARALAFSLRDAAAPEKGTP